MKDFLTRVAERALGTAPRIDPQATSRYAPARLPLPEPRLPPAEMPARVVSSPRTSRARQFDVEQESAEKAIKPSRGLRLPQINAPDEPQKPDQSPFALAPEPPANEVYPEPEFGAESIPNVSVGVRVPVPEPHEIESRRTPAFSSDAPSIGRTSDELESAEISASRDDSFSVGLPSSADIKREVQQRPPQTSPLKIVKRIVNESNESEEAVEPSSPPPVEVVNEDTPPAKVSRPREHQQPTRAAVSPIVAPPTATSERRSHDRPERREKNIQVRIGRVEVHAPPAPVTPVEPPGLPGPKLSLAEFLRQHNRRRDE